MINKCIRESFNFIWAYKTSKACIIQKSGKIPLLLFSGILFYLFIYFFFEIEQDFIALLSMEIKLSQTVIRTETSKHSIKIFYIFSLVLEI